MYASLTCTPAHLPLVLLCQLVENCSLWNIKYDFRVCTVHSCLESFHNIVTFTLWTDPVMYTFQFTPILLLLFLISHCTQYFFHILSLRAISLSFKTANNLHTWDFPIYWVLLVQRHWDAICFTTFTVPFLSASNRLFCGIWFGICCGILCILFWTSVRWRHFCLITCLIAVCCSTREILHNYLSAAVISISIIITVTLTIIIIRGRVHTLMWYYHAKTVDWSAQ